MSKSFEKQILDQHFKQNQKLDPFVYVTPQVAQFASSLNTMLTFKFIASYLFVNTIVSPLHTIVSSLQLSVKKHKDIYQTQQAKSKQLAKLNTQMTIHEKRKFQLMIRAGGKTQPYVAPVYSGYKQTIQGLAGQGWKAFYKGLSFRTLTSLLYLFPLSKANILISQQQIQQGFTTHYLKLYGFCMFIDIFLNPLYMQEYRFILQNRLPQFRTFKKPFKSLNRMMQQGEASKGLSYHIINNTFGFLTRIPAYVLLISGQPLTYLHYGAFLVGQFLTYPFSTAYKRLQCQTERYFGMIPVRYTNLPHALRVMTFEEGAKGLWRAFPLHAVQSMLRLKLLQILTAKPKRKQ